MRICLAAQRWQSKSGDRGDLNLKFRGLWQGEPLFDPVEISCQDYCSSGHRKAFTGEDEGRGKGSKIAALPTQMVCAA